MGYPWPHPPLAGSAQQPGCTQTPSPSPNPDFQHLWNMWNILLAVLQFCLASVRKVGVK